MLGIRHNIEMPVPNPSQQLAQEILSDFQSLGEKLNTLSDEIWLSIDHDDPKQLQTGVRLKAAFNEKRGSFRKLKDELSRLFQEIPGTLSARSGPAALDRQENSQAFGPETDDLVAVSLSMTGDLTFTRPRGFQLVGYPPEEVRTWREFLQALCQRLLALNRERFRSLAWNRELRKKGGSPYISEDSHEFRWAIPVDEGLFVEGNLSANNVCEFARRLLTAFGIPSSQLTIRYRASSSESVPAIPPTPPQTVGNTAGDRQRGSQESDHGSGDMVPLSITDDVTFAKPCRFRLAGQDSEPVQTWKQLLAVFCGKLLSLDQERFRNLASNPEFRKPRAGRYFSESTHELRVALPVGAGLYVETHLNANQIFSLIQKLLITFKIPQDQLTIFAFRDRKPRE